MRSDVSSMKGEMTQLAEQLKVSQESRKKIQASHEGFEAQLKDLQKFNKTLESRIANIESAALTASSVEGAFTCDVLKLGPYLAQSIWSSGAKPPEKGATWDLSGSLANIPQWLGSW